MNSRTWSPVVMDIGDRIAALTLAGAAALQRYLFEVHGIKAAAGLVIEAHTPARDRQPPPPPPTEFRVVLGGFEATRKIPVIKVVREWTGLGLKEAKDLVEGAPQTVKDNLPPTEAERLKGQLEAAGASVSLVGLAS